MTDRTIEISKTIDVPPERVFQALTEAGELERWFPSTADSDPRTGGGFEYRFEFPNEPERDHRYGGAYHEVAANERVSYPWSGKLGETRVDVELRESGEATEVTLRHTGWREGDEWSESLKGADRLRFTSNVFTRVRACTAEGKIDLMLKGGANKV